MKEPNFFTRVTLLRHTMREMLTSPAHLKQLSEAGESAYASIVEAKHHKAGVLVKYRFRAGKRQYYGWSHYTGAAFRNALNVGNHIKIVYVKGRPAVSRWVEDDEIASLLPAKTRGFLPEKDSSDFGNWVNHFRQK